MKLFTIGHSSHSIEKFGRLLEDNGIMTLVDVRTAPYSRYNPQFNKESLKNTLSNHNIEYAYAGKYLGGRPSDPTCYKSRVLPPEEADYLHEVDYPEVMKRPWFVRSIKRLLELANEQTTVIMCSEENPAECHRHHLIARYFITEYPEVNIQHIRGNGIVYSARSILISVNKPSVEQLSFGDGFNP
ncbi:MAG: hypothetical protein COW04_02915 [Deltaproteobacteria bacterium CG12_big_fil_rev_8_21_14_0_65_43_10]|nr:MAG: hypothetical protein AUK23_10520 [Deltaproteobacteria bacterium CG2_30_43_15]PIQ46280.1 MAG: hypothetical protein COW04_02915 [Deltaproteobacteria bacterium CG12_big_fil_rev_8_21_14_0_65_43_10]PIU86147.1 MAG: hypothetical protein COS67_04015 [Deltaproteobacteria bacterium CG06_land_8_20_14_3_00_44_19]PIX24204.1 MAG: hypothetical protein COZ68_07025 [Deltaproteobacteria bacterium CG_4_8_14_3_um_filter_43_13]PIZ20756.1 MAG: hypothetical protein COY50_02935 [Deltaproteobacteria bacterium C